MLKRFDVRFSEGVKEDFKNMRPYDRLILLEAIEAQLTHVPNCETRKRKRLRNLVPPFEAIPPVWQFRVGNFRVWYDINEEEYRVYVRAVRRKPAHLKTEDIL